MKILAIVSPNTDWNSSAALPPINKISWEISQGNDNL